MKRPATSNSPRFAVYSVSLPADAMIRSFMTLEKAIRFATSLKGNADYYVMDGHRVVWRAGRFTS